MRSINAHLQCQTLYEDPGILGGKLLSYTCDKEVSCDWSDRLDSEVIWVCLTLRGTGVILGKTIRLHLTPGSLGIFSIADREEVTATRLSSPNSHEFIALRLPLDGLLAFFGKECNHFHQSILETLTSGGSVRSGFGIQRTLSLYEKDICEQLLEPPVDGPALKIWYQARVNELLALHLFRPVEKRSLPFCSQIGMRQKVYIEKAIVYLREHLDEPLQLKVMASHVGCAPHYLSRTFSEETGKTLSRYLRSLRIDKAAEILEQTDLNITETALEVGYQSLSHFTKAFQEERGIRPSDYVKSLAGSE